MVDFFAGEPERGQDYSGTVVSMAFVEGKFGPQVVLSTELDDPFSKNDGSLVTEMPAFYGLPDGWTCKDGRLLAPDGNPDKALTAKNKWQKVCIAVGDMPEARTYLSRDGLTPYHENAWTGARFHFVTVEANQDYTVKDRETGETKTGKTKGFPCPVEWLGSKGNAVAGQVGATAPAVFNPDVLSSELIAKWGELAAVNDPTKFASLIVASGDLTAAVLGENLGPVTKAVGDGTLHASLVPF